ncbi:MAG: hypothetical protein WC552_06450, partial [Candidatus Omnitrophota bacterium]
MGNKFSQVSPTHKAFLGADPRCAIWGDAILDIFASREVISKISITDMGYKTHSDYHRHITSNQFFEILMCSILADIGYPLPCGKQRYKSTFFEALVAYVYEANGGYKGHGFAQVREFVLHLFKRYLELRGEQAHPTVRILLKKKDDNHALPDPSGRLSPEGPGAKVPGGGIGALMIFWGFAGFISGILSKIASSGLMALALIILLRLLGLEDNAGEIVLLAAGTMTVLEPQRSSVRGRIEASIQYDSFREGILTDKATLETGYAKTVIPGLNGCSLPRNRYLEVGKNLSRIVYRVFYRAEEIAGIVFVGLRKGRGNKIKHEGKSAWKWDGEAFRFCKESHPVEKELRQLYNPENMFDKCVIDITSYLGRAALRRGCVNKRFLLPNGRSWGRVESIIPSENLTAVKLVIEKENGKVKRIIFIGEKKGVRGRLCEAGRSVWLWSGKKFERDRSADPPMHPVKQSLIQIYERHNPKETCEVDITEYLGATCLRVGIMRKSFPLPNGKTWGHQEFLKLGWNLSRIKLIIKKDEKGEVESFTFYGYRKDSGGKDVLIGESFWRWTGKAFLYQEERLSVVEALRRLYQEAGDKFSSYLDITKLFSKLALIRGVLPTVFIFPDGQQNDRMRYPRLGIHLQAVHLAVRREGTNMLLMFLAYKRGNMKTVSIWRWLSGREKEECLEHVEKYDLKRDQDEEERNSARRTNARIAEECRIRQEIARVSIIRRRAEHGKIAVRLLASKKINSAMIASVLHLPSEAVETALAPGGGDGHSWDWSGFSAVMPQEDLMALARGFLNEMNFEDDTSEDDEGAFDSGKTTFAMLPHWKKWHRRLSKIGMGWVIWKFLAPLVEEYQRRVRHWIGPRPFALSHQEVLDSSKKWRKAVGKDWEIIEAMAREADEVFLRVRKRYGWFIAWLAAALCVHSRHNTRVHKTKQGVMATACSDALKDNSSCLDSIIAGLDEQTTFAERMVRRVRSFLAIYRDVLTKEETRALQQRYGIRFTQIIPLASVASGMGMTTKEARQVIVHALRKLRSERKKIVSEYRGHRVVMSSAAWRVPLPELLTEFGPVIERLLRRHAGERREEPSFYISAVLEQFRYLLKRMPLSYDRMGSLVVKTLRWGILIHKDRENKRYSVEEVEICEKVLKALEALYREGNIHPSLEDISFECGLSSEDAGTGLALVYRRYLSSPVGEDGETIDGVLCDQEGFSRFRERNQETRRAAEEARELLEYFAELFPSHGKRLYFMRRHYLDGLSFKNIAKEAGCSEETVRWNIRTGTQDLREKIAGVLEYRKERTNGKAKKSEEKTGKGRTGNLSAEDIEKISRFVREHPGARNFFDLFIADDVKGSRLDVYLYYLTQEVPGAPAVFICPISELPNRLNIYFSSRKLLQCFYTDFPRKGNAPYDFKTLKLEFAEHEWREAVLGWSHQEAVLGSGYPEATRRIEE